MRLPPPAEMYSPALWMNGTSDSRWRRKTASVATSLSATRSRKRPTVGGSAERERARG